MHDDKDAHRRRLLGVAFMCVGVFAFTFQDLIIKGISGTYPAHEIVFIRSLLALPLALLIARFETGLHRLRTPRIGAHLLRGVVFFLAYTLYYLGIAALPLAMAVAISFAAPLFITALAGPLLGEKVGKIRWLAVILGFVGVLIVMKDGLSTLEWAVVLPAVSALCYALGQLHGRHIGVTESASTMSVYVNVVFFVLSGLAGLVIGSGAFAQWSHPSLVFLLRAWIWPTGHDLLLIIGCAVAATIGIYCLAQGYRMAEANLAAIFEYTALPWAILWGFLFFSQLPGLSALAGVGLVIFAGIVIAVRERPRRMALRGNET
ncbi:MAG: DMT family transporter [Parvibaculaceae bacterium]